MAEAPPPVSASPSVGELPPLEAYGSGSGRPLDWTPLRKEVLELLWSERRPLGAYAISRALREAGGKGQAVSVYRVLRWLEDAGLVVHIASLKRYLIAPRPLPTDWLVLVCRACNWVNPLPSPSLGAVVRTRSLSRKFRPRHVALECLGLCPDCSAAAARANDGADSASTGSEPAHLLAGLSNVSIRRPNRSRNSAAAEGSAAVRSQ